ncbi:MAG: MFS transporter [Gaiellales bacterium]|nr:MFS transporter [Gaiellales bacterium]
MAAKATLEGDNGAEGSGRLLAPGARRTRSLALLAVSAGVFVSALDQTMVVTVLPPILQDLRVPLTRLDSASWIITGYLLGYTVAMPLFGRLADVRGRRIMYMVALVIFTAGSAACAFSSDLPALVAARVFQAAGGGALVPIGMAVAADLFEPRRRGLALGIIGAAAEAGGVLGPLYGAALTHLGGWKLIFLVNIPLGLALATSAWLTLTGPIGGRRVPQAGHSVDYIGAALLAATLTSLTVGLGGNSQVGSAVVKPWWLTAAGVALLVFILWERQCPSPLISLSFFRRRAFAAAVLANLAVGAALIVGMVEIPLYAYSLLGKSEIQGGLLLMRLTVMIPVGALIGGWLADRVTYALTATIGFLMTGAAYALIAHWPAAPGEMLMTRDLVLAGLGFGLVIAPISAAVIRSVGNRFAATGSAFVTVSRMVGMTVGLSALSSWGLRRFNALIATSPLPLRTAEMTDAEYAAQNAAYQDTITSALRTLYADYFLVAAGIAVLAIMAAAFLGRSGRQSHTGHPFLPPL